MSWMFSEYFILITIMWRKTCKTLIAIHFSWCMQAFVGGVSSQYCSRVRRVFIALKMDFGCVLYGSQNIFGRSWIWYVSGTSYCGCYIRSQALTSHHCCLWAKSWIWFSICYLKQCIHIFCFFLITFIVLLFSEWTKLWLVKEVFVILGEENITLFLKLVYSLKLHNCETFFFLCFLFFFFCGCGCLCVTRGCLAVSVCVT